jgi:hypothetical protein
MPFVEFRQRGGRGRFGFPVLTLLRSGGFNLNGAAYQELGRPSKVVLAYDVEDKRIGVRRAEGEEPYAYPVREVSSDSFWVAAQGFLRYYGLEDRSATRRYKAQLDGNYLAVDLKSEPLQRERRKENGGEEG